MDVGDAVDAGLRPAQARTEALRASLTARLDVESLLAQATATRQAAVQDADDMLAQAQQLAAELTSDSQREAERKAVLARADAEAVIAHARADSEAIKARAEADVEDYRRRVRAEVSEQLIREVTEKARADMAAIREQSAAMIGDLSASVHILGVALDTAQANVAEMLGALDELRVHSVEGPQPAPPTELDVDELDVDELDVDEPDGVADQGIGLLLVVDDQDDQDDEDDQDDKDEQPRTALQAYLQSAHIDFGDPKLPDVDDSEVGARYARDAGHELTGGSFDVDPSDRDTDTRSRSTDKPLGWLFRSTP